MFDCHVMYCEELARLRYLELIDEANRYREASKVERVARGLAVKALLVLAAEMIAVGTKLKAALAV